MPFARFSVPMLMYITRDALMIVCFDVSSHFRHAAATILRYFAATLVVDDCCAAISMPFCFHAAFAYFHMRDFFRLFAMLSLLQSRGGICCCRLRLR